MVASHSGSHRRDPDPVADERAVYLAEGDASLDGQMLEPHVLYVLRPGTSATLRSGISVVRVGWLMARPLPGRLDLRCKLTA